MSPPTDEYIDVIYTTNNFGQLHAKFPLTHFPQTAWKDKETLIECLENKLRSFANVKPIGSIKEVEPIQLVKISTCMITKNPYPFEGWDGKVYYNETDEYGKEII